MDINAIKKRLSQLQSTNTRTSNLWKPQPGIQQVRIVPYKFNPDTPFIELFFHYNLGGKNYLSPISFGRPDPIEEFSQRLKTTGNKDDFTLGRKLESKMRTFAPVMVRGEEIAGVKFWGFGKTVYQELLSIIADPDYGDISDPINGRDITLEFKTAEETGASFPSTSIRVKPNVTKLTEDSKVLAKVKETQKDIREIYNELSYDELTKVLNEWLNPDEETSSEKKEKPVNEFEQKLAEDKAKKQKVQPTNVKNASSQFDDLFNN
jgi:hypothetical protein